MAKKCYVGVNGVARKVKKGYVGVDGIARKIKKAYVGVNGVARLCWSGEIPTVLNNATWKQIAEASESGIASQI